MIKEGAPVRLREIRQELEENNLLVIGQVQKFCAPYLEAVRESGCVKTLDELATTFNLKRVSGGQDMARPEVRFEVRNSLPFWVLNVSQHRLVFNGDLSLVFRIPSISPMADLALVKMYNQELQDIIKRNSWQMTHATVNLRWDEANRGGVFTWKDLTLDFKNPGKVFIIGGRETVFDDFISDSQTFFKRMIPGHMITPKRLGIAITRAYLEAERK